MCRIYHDHTRVNSRFLSTYRYSHDIMQMEITRWFAVLNTHTVCHVLVTTVVWTNALTECVVIDVLFV